MTILKDFLKTQEDRLLIERAERAEKKKRWEAAVLELFQQISRWIAESDPHKLAEVHLSQVGALHTDGSGNLREPDNLARMEMTLGNVSVNLIPTTRDPLWPRFSPGPGSWAGEITMHNFIDKYQIYLFRHERGQSEWYIRDPRNYEFRPFDRATFEAALVELLS